MFICVFIWICYAGSQAQAPDLRYLVDKIWFETYVQQTSAVTETPRFGTGI